ncbi:phosphoribosylformylglycinamidine cyclo-ligase [Listeria fleischmannii]|uniref:Phosphoribosylformylglycinamidine cyclo-ligase n=1 Tax=Listeria fleischmannii TaxID=1069827 RepID=A0A841YGY8_9LIST|nr:phosphoribosylformylglycinamidine cyclo-ligase [Listeria fleischmannii]EIA19656.1 phosphoribosylaminoimidazole synthetase [Listeria fleischmannii subsp. coloradonensis]MBC1399414.1 phosphoribosylformylglycinamidine cyclo-ligase [Listeria fleischmannii]MBC1427858.1 phosphoribosylformylglycinamidine cyclo-ligase [Listeria fleischmannii]STY46713.1 Phosphoribosylformylglycinamidine cyclo-ligase [Listeria fleischmannii subsp. coloradonensis]
MENAYSKAGVDVHAGYEVVERIQKHVEKTKRLGVMGTLGSFGGMFDLSALNLKEPVLVSGTDGVGTKLMLAIAMNKHDTIGIDCVAMCVNDILAQGAEPLFFLDYIATGKNNPSKMEQIVQGVATGCEMAGCALIGGETAEMPDMYAADDYDLAGFTLGAVEKSQLIHKDAVQNGDILIGLPSSGIHSNGYSLVRKIYLKDGRFQLEDTLPELPEGKLGDYLLEPTKIYVKPVLNILKQTKVNGIAHITGGGFIENLPRMLGEHLAAEITLGSWPELPIFNSLKMRGQLDEMEMFNIFNMGIGLVLAVPENEAEKVLLAFKEQNEKAYQIGRVTEKQTEPVTFVRGDEQ